MKSALMTKLTMAAVGAVATMTFGTATSAEAADLTFVYRFETINGGTGSFTYTDGMGSPSEPIRAITHILSLRVGILSDFVFRPEPNQELWPASDILPSNLPIQKKLVSPPSPYSLLEFRSDYYFPYYPAYAPLNTSLKLLIKLERVLSLTGLSWGMANKAGSIKLTDGNTTLLDEKITLWTQSQEVPAVPEPFTITGTLLGLAGVVAARRKRQNAKAS